MSLTDSPIRRWRLYADSPYGQIHFHLAAPASGKLNKRPLACFHTSPLSGAEYALFMAEMAKDRLVLAPDNPGFGGSDRPGSPQTIPQLAAAHAEALLNTGLFDGKIDILGNHTGVPIAVAMATAIPERIHKVVLAGAPFFDAAGRVENLKRYGSPNPIFTDPDYVPNSFKSQVLGDSPRPQERRFDLFIEGLRSGTLAWWAPQAVMTYAIEEALPRMAQPALFLLTADFLDPNTRDAAKRAPDATVVDLSDKVDAPAWDLQPALLAEAIRAFLDA